MGSVGSGGDGTGEPAGEQVRGGGLLAGGVNGAGTGERAGSDGLFEARFLPRDDEGGGGGSEDLAHGVVAAHGDHGGGLADPVGQAGAGSHHGGRGPSEGLGAGEAILGQLGAGHDDVFVAGGHPCAGRSLDEGSSVGASAGRGEHVGAGEPPGVWVHVGASRGQVAGEEGTRGQGRRDLAAARGVVDARVAVDPHLVDQGHQGVGAAQPLPLAGSDGGVVEDVAQSQDDAGSRVGAAQRPKRGLELAADPQRVSVDDDQVGAEDQGAQRNGLGQGAGEPTGNVDSVSFLDSRQHQPVEAVGQGEQGRGSKARDNESAQPSRADARGDVVGERQVPPHVPQPLGVVAVQQHG